MNPCFLRRLVIPALAFLLWAGWVGPARAQTINWTNTAGGLWETAGNWNPNQAPVSTTGVTFNVDGAYTIYVTNSTADANPSSMSVKTFSMGNSAGDNQRLVINYTNPGVVFRTDNAGGTSGFLLGGGTTAADIYNGTVDINGDVRIGNAAGTRAQVNLWGGNFAVRDTTLYVGSTAGGTGTFMVAGGNLYWTNMASGFGGPLGGGSGGLGTMILSNGTITASRTAAGTAIFVVGRSGGRGELFVHGGTLALDTMGMSVGNTTATTGYVLQTGGEIIATNMTGSGSSFFIVGGTDAGSMVVSNQGVFTVNRVSLGGAAGGRGNLTITEGGRLNFTGVNYLRAGQDAAGFGSVSNINGGTIQFTIDNPNVAVGSGTGNGAVRDATIEFKNVGAADLGGNVSTFFTYSGTNTLRLIGATNKSVAAYSLQTNGTAFAFLDLAGANSAFQATNLTVGAGASVVGTGTLLVNSATNLGILAPGHSAGVLAFSSNLTLGSSSILNVEIGGTNSSDFDRLLASGTLTLGGTLNVSLINGYVPTGGETFDILDAGLFSGLFATQNLPSAEWSFSESTGVLTFAVIPEPGAAALVALGGLVAFALRRRRAA